jgi:hypothetical protein
MDLVKPRKAPGYQVFGQRFAPGSPEYEAELLTNRPRRSVCLVSNDSMRKFVGKDAKGGDRRPIKLYCTDI